MQNNLFTTATTPVLLFPALTYTYRWGLVLGLATHYVVSAVGVLSEHRISES